MHTLASVRTVQAQHVQATAPTRHLQIPTLKSDSFTPNFYFELLQTVRSPMVSAVPVAAQHRPTQNRFSLTQQKRSGGFTLIQATLMNVDSHILSFTNTRVCSQHLKYPSCLNVDKHDLCQCVTPHIKEIVKRCFVLQLQKNALPLPDTIKSN